MLDTSAQVVRNHEESIKKKLLAHDSKTIEKNSAEMAMQIVRNPQVEHLRSKSLGPERKTTVTFPR